jgi:hypothetical protein
MSYFLSLVWEHALFQNARIQVPPVERLERRGKRRFQKPLIPDSVKPAELLHQILMKAQDLPFVQALHLASS